MFTRIVTVLAIASALAVSTSGAMAEGGTPDYPQVFESQLSRAQVLAELAEARRLHLVPGGERTVVPTAAQAEQIRLAGLKAAMPMVAAR
jgi:hypothetical protein